MRSTFLRTTFLNGRAAQVAFAAALALSVAACAGTGDVATTPAPGGKLSDVFATPDWAKFTGAKKEAAVRAVTAEDLIGADGSCAARVASADPAQVSDAANAGAADPSAPAVAGGIALAMTECEVAQRAGAPSQIDIGADPSGERTASLTFTSGPWPGLYRFRAGRLVSIERVEAPAPVKQKKPAKRSPRAS